MPEFEPNPEMLRRAIEACRNIQSEAKAAGVPNKWFDWVPQYLTYWADQIDGSDADFGTAVRFFLGEGTHIDGHG